MPIYNKLALGKQAKEFGFVRDAYEKMSRLAVILQFIGAERELSPQLALKGGTAINLAVFDLPRLSVDIDMDFSVNLPREEMQEERNRINELLGRYMAAEGYTLRDKSKHTHALDSFVFSYTNAAGNPDNIKVEINYMLRCHALPIAETNIQTALFPVFTARMVAPIEIFASKIVALSGRAAIRDLYDLNNMIQFGVFAEPDLTLLRKCAILYQAIAGEVGEKGIGFSKADRITARMVKTDLLPMIRHAERFDFAAAKERVATFLSDMLIMTDKETAFLQRFSEGYYEPGLLFDDKDIVSRIENHPMAIWRTRRIKEGQQ